MSKHTEEAHRRLRDVRAAIFVETGDVDETDMIDTLEQIDKLEDIQDSINKVETAIKEYADND